MANQAELLEEFLTQVHTASAAYDFNLVKIEDGPLKGKILLDFQGKKPCRLLELPAEIRNRIYSYVVTQPEPIKLYAYNVIGYKGRENHMKPVTSRVFCSHHDHPDQFWDRKRGKWVPTPPGPLALLQVNKQIHEEAATIAYGENCFASGQANSFNHFFKAIGSKNLSLLTQLDAGSNWSDASVREMLKTLRQAPNLRTIWMSDSVLHYDLKRAAASAKNKQGSATDERDWAVVLARRLKKLLLGLQADYKAAGRTWKALDLIKISKPDKLNIYSPIWHAIPAAPSMEKRGEIIEKFMTVFSELANKYLKEE